MDWKDLVHRTIPEIRILISFIAVAMIGSSISHLLDGDGNTVVLVVTIVVAGTINGIAIGPFINAYKRERAKGKQSKDNSSEREY